LPLWIELKTDFADDYLRDVAKGDTTPTTAPQASDSQG